MRLAWLPLVALSLHCGDRTGLDADEAPTDASKDIRVADVSRRDSTEPDAPMERDAGKARCPTPPDGGAPTSCGRVLTIVSITPSSKTCFLDLGLSYVGGPGTLSFVCQGRYAHADFDKAPGFAGSYDNDFVDVCFGTTFKYSDGCTWSTAQRISGTLASGVLQFEYSEAPILGSACASPCSATGVISVQ